MKLLVVGAGIGGLGAAVALRQQGFDVDVVEIKQEFSVYGVGINHPANSLRALRSLGVLDETLGIGYQFRNTTFLDEQGELIVRLDSAMGGDDMPANNALSRLDLHRILIAAAERHDVKIQYGKTMRSFTDTGGEVEVVFTDGRQEAYDLVVAFDGIKSPTRHILFGPEHDAVYSGFGVFRVTLPRPDFLDGTRVYQAVGVKAGFLPLSVDSMYMFIVTPDPAHVIHRPEDFVDVLRERMAPFGSLPGEVRDSLTSSDDIVYSRISDVLLPLPWFRGRVGVLGDAAHACAPHLTQGAGMALEDAVVLAECLAADGTLAERLRAFEQRRYPRAKLVQDVSRGILESEMGITEATWGATVQGMRDHLAEQMGGIERFLDAPA
ncbi:FAD-dependent monooxygenase [Streptomyces sp. NBC_00878]|uniref:FAD-dependent monooxygenase n=1 Tax=Streptomyces sp. NBC_00878 TaxID=2975854 RepID=UPI0022596ED9|nr:FAD-dependent monooxygenase [Streptomyces sp. NBC_00878]MCX4903833.1 FAD-dependent monooxygenase [Streptomyces sp. NBC_00878]